MSTRNIT